MELVFASSNRHKLSEINALVPKGFKVLGLADVGIFEDIPETGSTIKENSFLKADYVRNYLARKNSTMPVFADDSGLEVMVLNGAPGVYSARYAGVPKSDAKNNTKLLAALSQKTARQARFVTVITLLTQSGVNYFEGEIKGSIAFEPRGSSGFGYDPLFIPQGYRSTFAELGSEVKNNISHRARAVKQLLVFLNTLAHQ